MRSFDEFMASRSLDPILEELAFFMMDNDINPYQALREACKEDDILVANLYESENRFNEAWEQLEEGQLDEWNPMQTLSNVGQWAGNAAKRWWDTSATAQGAKWAGDTAARGWEGAKRAGQWAMDAGADQMKKMGLMKAQRQFNQIVYSLQDLVNTLNKPEWQQMAQQGQLRMSDGNTSLADFFGKILQSMQGEQQHIQKALDAKTIGARRPVAATSQPRGSSATPQPGGAGTMPSVQMGGAPTPGAGPGMQQTA